MRLVFLALLCGWPAFGTSIAFWNFNSSPPDADFNTGTLQPATGQGVASLVGGVSGSFTASNGSSDPNADNSNWRITTWPAQGTQNKQFGIQFRISTAGYRNLTLSWDLRNSNTASKYARLQYTTNGVDYIDHQVITMPAETWVNSQSASFAGLAGVDNNPSFGIRFVTEFESTAMGAGTNGYLPANPISAYGPSGTLRFDMVLLTGDLDLVLDRVSVLSYNILGNGATNWSLSDPQVTAIGRQLAYLKPDIIGFQEIPESWYSQMDEFVATYLPGHQVVIGVRTDGGERSGVASRFTINRWQSWMARSNLTAFGYNGPFTRDLFEAEIAVPGFPVPLHFFTTHLKAHPDEESSIRRAAEARAISNFFATAFLPNYPQRPYVLVGDMNEDIDRPRTYEQQAIQSMTGPGTGLRLTTPRNPVTQDERSWSIRNASLSIRFDYILPGGLLFSNVMEGQIFRSDKVSPLPPSLQAGDSAAGADHLPVWMVFGNPYDGISTDTPPSIYGLTHSVTLANTVANLPFTADDHQTASGTLTFTVTSSNARLFPPGALTVTGSGPQRFLRVQPAPDQTGGAWVTVSVSDGSLTSSTSFALKVHWSEVITLWDFNSRPPDNDPATGTLQPAIGTGVASGVGTTTNSVNSSVSAVSFDPETADNAKWRLASFPAQGTGNKTSGAQFRVSTAGYRNIGVSWDHYNSATGSRYWRLQYSLDGLNFTDFTVYTNPVETAWFPTGASLHNVPGANDNPNFTIRLVSEWESTATGQGLNQYVGTQSSGSYSTVGTLWLDMVTLSGELIKPQLTIQPVANQLRVAWPASSPGFRLQSTPTLAPPAWTPYAGTPVVVGNENVLWITNFQAAEFLRLAR